MPRGLTPRRHRFALLVFQGETQADAYKQAFNAENMAPATIYEEASRLARNPDIAARIAELTAQAEAAAIVNENWVKERLMTNADRCMQEIQPIIGRDGKPTGEFKYDANGANTALKLLGQSIGMFSGEPKTDGPTATIEHEPQSEEQWASEAQEPKAIEHDNTTH